VRGMLEGLDPHSVRLIWSLKPFRGLQWKAPSGQFVAWGIEVGQERWFYNQGYLAPFDDTPAARAGIEAGESDRQIEINRSKA